MAEVGFMFLACAICFLIAVLVLVCEIKFERSHRKRMDEARRLRLAHWAERRRG